MAKHSPWIRDYGGNSQGRKYSQKGTVVGYCNDCQAKTFFIRKELYRASRPKCSRCGGFIELSSQAKKILNLYLHRDGEAKKCDSCGSKLNYSNKTGTCARCSPRISKQELFDRVSSYLEKEAKHGST